MNRRRWNWKYTTNISGSISWKRKYNLNKLNIQVTKYFKITVDIDYKTDIIQTRFRAGRLFFHIFNALFENIQFVLLNIKYLKKIKIETNILEWNEYIYLSLLEFSSL